MEIDKQHQTVYDLDVAENGNFFVGRQGVLVHDSQLREGGGAGLRAIRPSTQLRGRPKSAASRCPKSLAARAWTSTPFSNRNSSL